MKLSTLFSSRREIYSLTGGVFPGIYLTAVGTMVVLFIGMYHHLGTAAKILAVSMSVMSLCFIILYGTRSNWRATREGRALMYLTIGFTATVLITASARLFSPFPGLDLLRFLIFAAFVMTEIHITATLYQAQTQQNRAPEDQRRENATLQEILSGPMETNQEYSEPTAASPPEIVPNPPTSTEESP